MRVALLFGLMLVAPAAALAQAPAGDSVTGSAGAGIGRGHVVYTFECTAARRGRTRPAR